MSFTVVQSPWAGLPVAPPLNLRLAWAGCLGMSDKRDKVLSYRRAVWLNPDSNRSLEKYLRNANLKLATLKDRWVALGEQVVRVAQVQNQTGGGLFLHITTETEGEAASVVPKVPPSSTGFDLKTQPPPANAEWLDGDAFLFVYEDHMCLCTTAVTDSAIMAFLLEYFKKAQLPAGSDKFDLLIHGGIAREARRAAITSLAEPPGNQSNELRQGRNFALSTGLPFFSKLGATRMALASIAVGTSDFRALAVDFVAVVFFLRDVELMCLLRSRVSQKNTLRMSECASAGRCRWR